MSEKPTYEELEQRIRELEESELKRKQREISERQIPDLLSLFIKYSPVFTFLKEVSNEQSKVLYASDNYTDMIGTPAPQMLGKTMEELFPAEFAEKITLDDIDVVTNDKVLEIEETLDGRDYITFKYPIMRGDKKYLAGYTIDITDRKRTEKMLKQQAIELQERNKELNCFFQISEILKDSQAKPLNQLLFAILKIIPLSWQYPDITCARLILEGNTISTENFMETAYKLSNDILVDSKKTGVLEICYTGEISKDGNGPFLEAEIKLSDALAERIGKIIERKKTTEALNQTKDIVENIRIGLHIYHLEDINDDRTLRMIYANPASEVLTGVKPVDVVGQTLDENFPDLRKKMIPQQYAEIVRNRTTLSFENISYSDNRVKRSTFKVKAFPLPGSFMGVSFENITAQRKAEKNYQTLFERMLNGFASHEIICDNKGQPIDYCFLNINPAFERMTGLKREDIIGKTVLEVLPGTEKYWIDVYGKVALSGKPINFENESRELGKYFEVTAFKTDHLQFACIFTDITKRKLAEKENEKIQDDLAQGQKMESIGNLAGGIAHDFNNILFPIIGMSELLLEDLPNDSPEHENVQEILTAGIRGSELVKQILAFSRQSEHKLIPLRIQQVLKEVLKLVHSTIPANINIASDIKQDCGLVMADPIQLHQVSMNLITNAYHAVESNNGNIEIKLKEKEIKNDLTSPSFLKAGFYAVLTIIDTGHGIAPEVLDKIFEPYFTTKKQGKGTGLGLSVVHGIVKKLGGDLQVISELGKGSKFDVYLPLTKKRTNLAATQESATLPTGTEQILVVDDEMPILKLERQMLERLGYKVTTTINSMDAVNLFEKSPSKFDLVITDMAMPNLTGDKLAEMVLAIRSDIPVIICTGFSDQINNERMFSIGVKGCLMKPIIKSEMAQLIRESLDKRK